MRRVYVDASVCITLAEIGYCWLLETIEGELVVPVEVIEEVNQDPGASELQEAIENGWLEIRAVQANTSTPGIDEEIRRAKRHLGVDEATDDFAGDVALLALGISADDCVVVTDDKPLRKTCKMLGINVSGSIGVLVAGVKLGELERGEAKDALIAMDEVGARLSARLLRRAERLIDEAAEV